MGGSQLKFLLTDDYETTGTRCITNKRLFLSLIAGFIIGCCLGYFQIILSNSKHLYEIYTPCETTIKTPEHHRHHNHHHHHHNEIQTDNKHYEKFHTLAKEIYKEVKVLCWVLTSPDNHIRRARHVKNTWGRRCNKLLFISSEADPRIGSIGFNITEGRDFLWHKTRAAFDLIYKKYLDDYDWFLKADDDTYVIMENLRFFLASHSSDVPIYFGSKFQLPGAIYMSGGAGYVLSKEAVKRLVKIAFINEQICHLEGYNEDYEIGLCLQGVGVIPGDTRDEKGRTRFHPLGASMLRPNSFKNNSTWLWKYQYYKSGLGLQHVSDKAISFHYLHPNDMYLIEYLVYRFQIYGIWKRPEPIPNIKFTYDEEINMLKESENNRNLKEYKMNNVLFG